MTKLSLEEGKFGTPAGRQFDQDQKTQVEAEVEAENSEDSAKDPVPDEYQYHNIRIPAGGAITKWRTRARTLPDKRRRGRHEGDVVQFGDNRSSARFLFSFLERSTYCGMSMRRSQRHSRAPFFATLKYFVIDNLSAIVKYDCLRP